MVLCHTTNLTWRQEQVAFGYTLIITSKKRSLMCHTCTNIQFNINLFYKLVPTKCHDRKDTENPYLSPSCWKLINCVYEYMNYIISSKKKKKNTYERSRSYRKIWKWGGNETVLLEQPLKSIHNNTDQKFAKWTTAVHTSTFLGNISQGT